MPNLFKRAAVFTDLHYGLKNNSQIHNQDCEEYIDWFIKTAKAHGCDTGICMGDFHHNRNTLNIITMDYSIRALEKLGKAFDQFFFFPGNHDLYFKDKRDVHSVAFGRHIPGITVINHPTTIDGVTMCPWLVGDEWKNIGKKGGQYIFGHFELPTFFMNAMIQMPDHGDLKLEQFSSYQHGFSGHFHKRQSKKNISYIGNAFPHNYADAWDDQRGMMILDWGGTPQYIDWPDCPKFRILNLSDLIDQKDKILKHRMYLKVKLDIDISFEEANFLKETFIEEYHLREISLIQENTDVSATDEVSAVKFDSVDQIVSDQITKIESTQFDNKKLLEIYTSL